MVYSSRTIRFDIMAVYRETSFVDDVRGIRWYEFLRCCRCVVTLSALYRRIPTVRRSRAIFPLMLVLYQSCLASLSSSAGDFESCELGGFGKS